MPIATKEYCGTIVLEVNGEEIECVSIEPTHKTNAKPVNTMNSKKRALGTACGTNEYNIKIEVPVATDQSKEFDSTLLKAATLTTYPACGTNGFRKIYTGVTAEEIGEKFSHGKESTRSITAHALDMQEVR